MRKERELAVIGDRWVVPPCRAKESNPAVAG